MFRVQTFNEVVADVGACIVVKFSQSVIDFGFSFRSVGKEKSNV